MKVTKNKIIQNAKRKEYNLFNTVAPANKQSLKTQTHNEKFNA